MVWEGRRDEGGRRKSVGMLVAGCCWPTLAAICDVVRAAERFRMEKTLKKRLQVHSVKGDLSSRLISGQPWTKGVLTDASRGKNRPKEDF